MVGRMRIGIVGASGTRGSGWGERAHIPAIKASPFMQLKAVCTMHPQTVDAARQKYGAELAFTDAREMAGHPEIDAVSVVVRVPHHRDIAAAALDAGKAVYCEWPLGTSAAEAALMANLALEKGLHNIVGLQARADPLLLFVRDLIHGERFIGEVLSASLNFSGQARWQPSLARSWQADRRQGANALTIPGGHSLDALCMCLGDFASLTAHLSTRISSWRTADTGEEIAVDAPDTISVAGTLRSGAHATVQIATVPHGAGGLRFEIFGSEGCLLITSPLSIQMGSLRLFGARGGEPSEMSVPDAYFTAHDAVPAKEPYNVAQIYARLADALAGGAKAAPDFAHAVRLHRLIETIERSSLEGRLIAVEEFAS